MTNFENTNLSGIYIHVPFCQSRCIYCDFYSTVYGEDFKDRYVERLLKEMADRKTRWIRKLIQYMLGEERLLVCILAA